MMSSGERRMLTSRPTETMEAPRRRLYVTGRVGPYELVREIARAPGVTLAEGRDAEEALWLLQLVRCRGVLGEDERTERHKHERVLAQRTAEMVSANEISVSAHGGAEVDHGERVLFWAFPYTSVPFVL